MDGFLDDWGLRHERANPFHADFHERAMFQVFQISIFDENLSFLFFFPGGINMVHWRGLC